MAATLLLSVAGAVVAYLLLSAVLSYISVPSRFLRAQPWIVHKQWFASFRAGMESVFGSRGMLAEGYSNFSKKSKLFVLPQLSTAPFVILPAEQVHEFLSKSDDRVDHVSIGHESIAMKWTIGSGFPNDDHFNVVRRQLTRKLPLLTSDVYAELVLGIEDQWPTGKDWTTVNIYPTCMKIVARAANRVFCGKELCRNDEFLEASRLYSQNVFMSGMIMRLIPSFLHPLAAPIVTRGVKKQLAICKRISMPIIAKRMKEMQEPDYKAPHDVLHWILEEVLAGKTYQADPEWICRCLLILNMVAIHTTSMVTANTLMDLYTSPRKDDFIAGLREECEREMKNGWTKDAVNNLVRVDSTIRETMRKTGLGDLGVPRVVKDPDGIDLGGSHLPCGVRVAVPAHAIHNDERFYTDAHEWDAFRFSRPREEGQQDLKSVLEYKNRGLVVTTDDFFSFGFGKHACPGRFFASQEIKLMLAYVVTKYDIEMDGGRPDNLLINGASVPKDDVQMRIRYRRT